MLNLKFHGVVEYTKLAIIFVLSIAAVELMLNILNSGVNTRADLKFHEVAVAYCHYFNLVTKFLAPQNTITFK